MPNVQLQNVHSSQTDRVNGIMDVGPHGKQHVSTRGRPFHPHTHTQTQKKHAHAQTQRECE